MNKPGIAALLALCLTPCVAAEQTPLLVELEDAWVRALPPTQATTAAYLTLTNRGQEAITVTGGSSVVAHTVEIHTSREIDGYMRMERVPGLTIEPGETARLAPGGMHLMLLGLERMPLPGECVRLCLLLSGGGEICTRAQVRKTAGAPAANDHHDHQE